MSAHTPSWACHTILNRDRDDETAYLTVACKVHSPVFRRKKARGKTAKTSRHLSLLNSSDQYDAYEAEQFAVHLRSGLVAVTILSATCSRCFTFKSAKELLIGIER
ncbi:hypothetical protein K443DRAFT_673721 [Laccaria amethystina LaAM-08-1]|uniref:Uncharacterized protein n=1 Tax=Laccaria amethystina LaAM-08-1 TaxID=1095629 RepID=A0A0C9YGK0_9AGAR|nr:hypothetical protein K443DRAFT_673721 [Laccaria amethystina LaAM-08-1]